jgi:Tfp pilus assembly protein PilN
MVESVNFLNERIAALKKQRKVNFLINLVSLVILGIFGLAMLILFSVYFVFKKESSVLTSKITDKKAQIEELRPIETKQVYLKDKLISLIEVLPLQKENQKIVEAIFNLIPEGISIDGFSIAESGEVRFNAKSYEFVKLKNFITTLESVPQVGDLRLDMAKVGGVSFKYDEGYSITLQLSFRG